MRSLDLDDWPGELTQVLAAIGNHMANSIWESCTQGRAKPTAGSSRSVRGLLRYTGSGLIQGLAATLGVCGDLFMHVQPA